MTAKYGPTEEDIQDYIRRRGKFEGNPLARQLIEQKGRGG